MLILEFAKSQILFHVLLFGRIQWYRPMLSLTWSLLVLMDITHYLMFLIPAIQRYFLFFKFLTCAFVHITFLCFYVISVYVYNYLQYSFIILSFWPNIFDLSLAQHWVSFASILVYLFLTFFNISIFCRIWGFFTIQCVSIWILILLRIWTNFLVASFLILWRQAFASLFRTTSSTLECQLSWMSIMLVPCQIRWNLCSVNCWIMCIPLILALKI